MLLNEQQQEFLRLRVLEGRSLESISEEIGVQIQTLREWSVVLIEQIEDMRMNEIDRVFSEAQINMLQHYRNLADIYKRLKKELDKRDFSGLPTDKLYYILNDVQEKLNHAMDNEGDDWDDYLDDLDDVDDFSEFE